MTMLMRRNDLDTCLGGSCANQCLIGSGVTHSTYVPVETYIPERDAKLPVLQPLDRWLGNHAALEVFPGQRLQLDVVLMALSSQQSSRVIVHSSPCGKDTCIA